MLYLLQQHSKSTDVPAKLWSQASSHPEVIQPRFVKERSPVNTIPTNLRSTVHAIYLQHAQQALIPVGRGWKDFDPLAPEHTMMLYPFEIETKDDIDQTILVENILMQGDGIFWGELPWPEIQQRLKVIDIAILPVGAIAQHGPHLPLDTKNYNSTYLAHKVALSCSSPKPLILPTIPYGVSYHHDEFPGTLSVSSNTLLNLIYDVGINAARSGVKKLVILNSHSGNIPVLNDAAQRISRDAGIFVCVDSGESSRADIYAMAETRNDVHAGEIETSRSLAVRPQLVRLSNAAKTTPQFTNRYLAFTSQRDISWYTFTKKITPTGIIGDPTHATAEKGENIWEIMIVHTVSLIEALKGMSLDEIYQLHY
jgi:creatinine amidohydrolase/Fe(II)-dependent formamide hydrolase-like protein